MRARRLRLAVLLARCPSSRPVQCLHLESPPAPQNVVCSCCLLPHCMLYERRGWRLGRESMMRALNIQAGAPQSELVKRMAKKLPRQFQAQFLHLVRSPLPPPPPQHPIHAPHGLTCVRRAPRFPPPRRWPSMAGAAWVGVRAWTSWLKVCGQKRQSR